MSDIQFNKTVLSKCTMQLIISKVKSQKYRTPRKIQNGKSIIKWQNQKLKRMDTNCHITDLVQAFSCVDNGG